jgi:hypothetical protein
MMSQRLNKKLEKSSGNVFDDPSLPNSEQELPKAKLTMQICRLVKARGLTKAQAQMSASMRCRPVSISNERLMEFPTILSQDVEVKLKPADPGQPVRRRLS